MTTASVSGNSFLVEKTGRRKVGAPFRRQLVLCLVRSLCLPNRASADARSLSALLNSRDTKRHRLLCPRGELRSIILVHLLGFLAEYGSSLASIGTQIARQARSGG